MGCNIFSPYRNSMYQILERAVDCVVKVEIVEQAMKAQRRSRGIAVGQCHVPAGLLPGKPCAHDIGSWMVSRAGLDACGKTQPPPGLYPRTVHPVASFYTD
jgi:hypothetical protein